MKSVNDCIDFIIVECQNIPHGNTNLTDHLLGVYSLLLQTNAPKYLCLAGLFHSIYGSEHFKPDITITRNQVAEYIGEMAEELVFLFCHFRDRDETILKSNNKDLIYLNLMNLIETQSTNNSDELRTMIERYQLKYSEIV